MKNLILFFLISTLIYSEKLIFYTMDSPPYQIEEDNRGYLVDIVREAFKEEGIEIEVKFVPWVRAMEDGRMGKVTGLIGAWYSKEREESFYYSPPIGKSTLSLYVNKKNEDNIDFSKMKIAFVKDYYYPEELSKSNFKEYLYVNNSEILIKFLEVGRVDIIAEVEELIAYNEKKDNKKFAIKKVGNVLSVDEIYLIISKKATNSVFILEKFNKGYDTLNRKGRVEEILKQYGIKVDK